MKASLRSFTRTLIDDGAMGGSEMVVRLEISGSAGKIVFEYSRDGCEKRISFRYLEGDVVKIEAVGRGDCAGFEFKIRGEADAVNRFLDMVAKELGLENTMRFVASMWGLENFGGVPKAFTMPLALDPSIINIGVVKNDSTDNAPGDGGAEEG